jgi:hypothetical protein
VTANVATKEVPRFATVFAAALLLVTTPAGATFRGHDGSIAFMRQRWCGCLKPGQGPLCGNCVITFE